MKVMPVIGTLLFLINLNAQSEALTSSPYSLYGLGSINQNGLGSSNGRSYTGIGLKTEKEINNSNPANFALIPKHSMLYDVGVRAQYNTYSNSAYSEAKTTFNFSNLAFAFRIADGLGAGISLVPYSDVGYSILGIRSNIEGSTETFESNVTGLGGLSDLRLNLGYSIWERLRFGLSASFLFGNIEEQEFFTVNSSDFQIDKSTNYNGARFGLGLQFDITENTTLGSTVQFPTALNGSLKRSVLKTLDETEVTVQDNEADAISDFKMPLEVGFGISTKLYGALTVSADYKKNYWGITNQTENIGAYADQDIYAIGLEYLNNAQDYKYAKRIRYRMGFNYDNGYLNVNNSKINGYTATVGIGLPINPRNSSMINLSYAYGSKGQIQNILIKENYHLLTLNLSLEDLWFVKRKID